MTNLAADLQENGRDLPPRQLRQAIRERRWIGPTPGLARGYVQTNLVIVPAAAALDFAEFCRLNPAPCPVIHQGAAGDPCPLAVAEGADIRTDVGHYRVFSQGELVAEPHDLRSFWRDDLVTFLLGCSFTFERALLEAGLPVRHIAAGRNVPMYRTSIACRPAGRFAGPLVVSMRPFPPHQVAVAREVTSQYPGMHGAPIHEGDPRAIGIQNLLSPEFGDPPLIESGEVPVFWACGVTPQLALHNCGLDLVITHRPGYMFVTDLRDENFHQPPVTQ